MALGKEFFPMVGPNPAKSDISGYRILLADPPEALRYSNYLIPHMGLAYLAAVAREEGVRVGTFLGQMQEEPLLTFRECLRRTLPDLVCFSAPTLKIRQAAFLAEEAKSLHGPVRTVIGGWHVTALPTQTMEEFPAFDLAVYGEGEHTLPQLIATLLRGRTDLDGVRGLVWRKGEEVRQTAPRGFLGDLDALPRPAWDLFSVERSVPMYRKAAKGRRDYPLMTARGCPYHCLFCKSMTGHKVRTRSVEGVLDEYEQGVRDYACDAVQFYDESFTVLPERARELCEQMLRRRIHEKSFWNCASRADGVSRELVFLMKRAGCRVIQFGLESGNQEILDKNRKSLRLEQSRNAVQWCREAGILSDVSFILGLPYENRTTLGKTIDFSFRLDPDFVSYFTLVPFPATEAFSLARAGEANLRLLDERWERFSKQFYPLITPKDVPPLTLVLLRFYAYARFYIRPSKIGNLLTMFDVRTLPRVVWYMLKQMKVPTRNRNGAPGRAGPLRR